MVPPLLVRHAARPLHPDHQVHVLRRPQTPALIMEPRRGVVPHERRAARLLDIDDGAAGLAGGLVPHDLLDCVAGGEWAGRRRFEER